MKKIFLSLTFVLISTFIFAQGKNQTPSAHVKQQIEVLKNGGLNLSDVQIGRITYVLMAEEQTMERTQKTFAGNKSLLNERTKEAREHMFNNLKGALTPQQVEQFDAKKLGDKL